VSCFVSALTNTSIKISGTNLQQEPVVSLLASWPRVWVCLCSCCWPRRVLICRSVVVGYATAFFLSVASLVSITVACLWPVTFALGPSCQCWDSCELAWPFVSTRCLHPQFGRVVLLCLMQDQLEAPPAAPTRITADMRLSHNDVALARRLLLPAAAGGSCGALVDHPYNFTSTCGECCAAMACTTVHTALAASAVTVDCVSDVVELPAAAVQYHSLTAHPMWTDSSAVAIAFAGGDGPPTATAVAGRGCGTAWPQWVVSNLISGPAHQLGRRVSAEIVAAACRCPCRACR
jgi:hypothetical protein